MRRQRMLILLFQIRMQKILLIAFFNHYTSHLTSLTPIIITSRGPHLLLRSVSKVSFMREEYLACISFFTNLRIAE